MAQNDESQPSAPGAESVGNANKYVVLEAQAYEQYLDEKFRGKVRADAIAPLYTVLKILGITAAIPFLILMWSYYTDTIANQAKEVIDKVLPDRVIVALARAPAMTQESIKALSNELLQWVRTPAGRDRIFDDNVQQQLRNAASTLLSEQLGDIRNAELLARRVARFRNASMPDPVRLAVLADLREADGEGASTEREIVELLRALPDGDASDPAWRRQMVFAIDAAQTAMALLDDARFEPRWIGIQTELATLCRTRLDKLSDGQQQGDIGAIFAPRGNDVARHARRLSDWLTLVLLAAPSAYPSACANALAQGIARSGSAVALPIARSLLRDPRPGFARTGLEVLRQWQPSPDDQLPNDTVLVFEAAIDATAALLAENRPPYLEPSEPRQRQARLDWLLGREASVIRPRADMAQYLDRRHGLPVPSMPRPFHTLMARWQQPECSQAEDDSEPCEAGGPRSASFGQNYENRAWGQRAQWLRLRQDGLMRAATQLPPPLQTQLVTRLQERLHGGMTRLAGMGASNDEACLRYGLELRMLAVLAQPLAVRAARETLAVRGLSSHPAVVYAMRATVLANPSGGIGPSASLVEAMLDITEPNPALESFLSWLLARLRDEEALTLVMGRLASRSDRPLGSGVWQAAAAFAAWSRGPAPSRADLGRPTLRRPGTAAEPPAPPVDPLLVLAAGGLAELLAAIANEPPPQATILAAAALYGINIARQPGADATLRRLGILLLEQNLSFRLRALDGPGLHPALQRLNSDFWQFAARVDAARPLDTACVAVNQEGDAFMVRVPSGRTLTATLRGMTRGMRIVAADAASRRVSLSPAVDGSARRPLPSREDRATTEIELVHASEERPVYLWVHVGDTPAPQLSAVELCIKMEEAVVLALDRAPVAEDFATAPSLTLAVTANAQRQPLRVPLRAGTNGGLVRFQAPPSTLVTIETTGPRGTDTEIEILNRGGDRLAYDDDGGDSNLSLLHWLSNGDEVMLRIGLFGGTLADEQIAIDTQLTAVPFGAIAEMRIGTPLPLTVETGQSGDLLRANLQAGRSYVVRTFDLGQRVDTVVTVRGPDFGFMGDNDDTGPGLESCLAFTPAASGTHFFELANIGRTGSFRVSLTEGASGCN